MVRVAGALFEPRTAQRVAWAIATLWERYAIRVSITEGYRSIGVPADRGVRVASQTSDGTPNQWYQKGRQDRGLTPSAATPGTSNHGWGEAGDAAWTRTAQNNARVIAVFRLAGLLFTIPSEWWHFDASGTVLAADLISAPLPTEPEPPAPNLPEDDMQTILIECTDGEGRYGAKNGRYYSLFTPATRAVQKINDPALANQLVVEFGRKNGVTGESLGTGFNCAYRDWEAFHGGSYDPRKP